MPPTREGLAVMANLPVRGERNGMDWGNPEQVAEQQRKVLAVVQELKDHPALMFWAVGNELDHIPGNPSYHPQLWERLNELAVAIKQIDTHHPVLTVVGTGHYERKVQEIAAACKDMDLLGVNAYGDLGPVTDLTRQHWPKPYVVAEWGPTGHWQVPKTKWRCAVGADEQREGAGDRRAVRADHPGRSHPLPGLVRVLLEREARDDPHLVWPVLQWPAHGVHRRDAAFLEWSVAGEPGSGDPGSEHRGLRIRGRCRSRRREPIGRKSQVTDPDSDPLTFAWDIRPEVEIPAGSYAGVWRKKRSRSGADPRSCLTANRIHRPETAGGYRLFVTAVDGQGHIAYGNIPFLVVTK